MDHDSNRSGGAKGRRAWRAPVGAPPTERELEVLRAVARTGSMRAASAELGLNEFTVRSHLSALYRRMGVHSAAQAVWRLWVEPDDRADGT